MFHINNETIFINKNFNEELKIPNFIKNIIFENCSKFNKSLNNLPNSIEKIVFEGASNFNQPVDNLLLILSREIRSNIDDISYIDLRFGNRIFYK